MSSNVDAPQASCAWCNHVLTPADRVCPGCGNRNPIYSARAHHAAEAAERRAASGEAAAGGAQRSGEGGLRGVLGETCAEGCVETVSGMLFGMIALAVAVGLVRRRARR